MLHTLTSFKHYILFTKFLGCIKTPKYEKLTISIFPVVQLKTNDSITHANFSKAENKRKLPALAPLLVVGAAIMKYQIFTREIYKSTKIHFEPLDDNYIFKKSFSFD